MKTDVLRRYLAAVPGDTRVVVLSPFIDAHTGNREEKEIVEVCWDDPTEGVYLLLSNPAPPRRRRPLDTAGKLLQRVRLLPLRCAAYRLFSGEWFQLGGRDRARFDWPLEGATRSEDGQILTFMESGLVGA